ncbi:MAG TPA: response regulator transcription factor [Pirellulales bacterium]|jgi:DNA-binding NarL/FixJ family response regulator|nr:response regulator transcription factor [Pirellulales bacterium]
MSVKVLVADDHEVVRSGLSSLFADSEVDVVAEATNGQEAVSMAVKHKPDVVLLDIRMGDDDGLDALEKIHRELPETPVVMLSTYDNPTYVARAVALGASDYVLKGASRRELISTIVAAVEGKCPSETGELRRVAGAMSRTVTPSSEEVPLTNRETQVLRHVALGLSNKEIGRSLTISIETVKEHVQNILRKIAVTDRTQAAVWAVRKGLV